MATKKLVDEIRELLCGMNKPVRRYSSVWLSLNDDLTGRERYIVNARTEHTVESRFDEMDAIFDVLHAKLTIELLRKISRIAVYNPDDQIPYDAGDIVVLEEEAVC